MMMMIMRGGERGDHHLRPRRRNWTHLTFLTLKRIYGARAVKGKLTLKGGVLPDSGAFVCDFVVSALPFERFWCIATSR